MTLAPNVSSGAAVRPTGETADQASAWRVGVEGCRRVLPLSVRAEMRACRVFLAFLLRCVPLPRLVGWLSSPRIHLEPFLMPAVAAYADRMLRNRSRACLLRSLLIYRFLVRTAARAEFNVGLGGAGPTPGHAWVSVEGHGPVFEHHAQCQRFPILVHRRPPMVYWTSAPGSCPVRE